jgi:hypothetical protein
MFRMTVSPDAVVLKPGSPRAYAVHVVGRNAAVRIVAHMAAWAPFVWSAAHLIRRGWRPVSDAAAIALRSWDVLTGHGPMVGQATRLAIGVFDPGPLQYWLLTLPVHLDPAHGLLWGAALWCMIAASLTVEAAWSVAGRPGALIAAGVVLALVAWMPGVALQPYWNPWFAMFLLASLAAGWAVMCGRRGWWPVLVLTASVAAQAHLMFTVISVALAFFALIVGLTDSIRDRTGDRWARYRWTVIGVVAGAACWSAPVVQQITSPAGNLAALIHGQANGGQRTGLAFGLKALAGAAQPPPMWWTPLQSLLDLNQIGQRSAVSGAVTVAVLAAVLVAAVRPLRARWLAALAGVSLLASAGAVFTYAGIAVQGIPAKPSTLDTLNYLMILLLPVGILCWLTGASAIALAGKRSTSRTSAQVGLPEEPGGRGRASAVARPGTGARRVVAVAGSVAIAGLALASSLTAADSWRQFPGVADGQVVRAVTASSRQIESRLPRQPVALSVVSQDRSYHKRRLLLGLALVLRAHGYSPRIAEFGWELGPAYVPARPPVVRVRVLLGRSGVSVRITRPS